MSNQITSMRLPPNEIHLWICRPNEIASDALLDRYRRLLTRAERVRQQRFVFERDRHTALVSRAVVRTVLSKYRKVLPEAWRFKRVKKGRPEILRPAEPYPRQLRFNLSHCAQMIACAVTLNDDVGADVEFCERKTDILGVCDRYFTPDEISDIRSLNPNDQRGRFFDFWTLKEAYIKARGLGLSIPLKAFGFHIESADVPVVSVTFSPDLKDDARRWRFWLFEPLPTHRLSVAVNATNNARRLRVFETVPLVADHETRFPLGAPVHSA